VLPVNFKEDLPRYILDCLHYKVNADLPTDLYDNFSLEDAYGVANDIVQLRENRGEKVKGIKIGFTNKTIWDLYNVNSPIYGRMFSSTILDKEESFCISKFLQPKLEPEIFFRLGEPPNSRMSDYELLSCCSHFGIGIELVQSIFKDWKFRLADTICAFSLHGEYKILKEFEISSDKDVKVDLINKLKDFSVTLKRNNQILEKGKASNILGSGPLMALRAYIEFCEKQKNWLLLDRIITTGTVTDAYDMEEGMQYSIDIDKFNIGPLVMNL
jgi:2-oxo-3-hexenedioate decarboxylase